MKSNVHKAFLFITLSLLAVTAFSQETIQGEELKKLLLGKGDGSTWAIANGNDTRISFFKDGTLLDCFGKKGSESCDTGTYTIDGGTITRTYKNLFKNDGGLRKLSIKKAGEKTIFNGSEVSKYSDSPTLLMASEEQIRALAGKDFVLPHNDGRTYRHNISKDLRLNNCHSQGCSFTNQFAITAPWIQFSYPGGDTLSRVIAIEDGNFLWGGRTLIPN